MNSEVNNIAYFDNFYKNYGGVDIISDNWLDHFKEFVDKADMPIVDLGCGLGNNTQYLLAKGKKVLPCDASEEAVKRVTEKFDVSGRCFDMLEPFPLVNNSTDLVIADLCLHYFTKEDTIKILKEIKRILVSKGNLIARVNSIANVEKRNDLYEEVEHHLYVTKDGRYKRFFDSKDIYELFNVLEVSHIWRDMMYRYGDPKEVYMVRLKNR